MKIIDTAIQLSDFLVQEIPGLVKTHETWDVNVGDGRFCYLALRGKPQQYKWLWMSWEDTPTESIMEIFGEKTIKIPKKNYDNWIDIVTSVILHFERMTNREYSCSQNGWIYPMERLRNHALHTALQSQNNPGNTYWTLPHV